MGSKNYTELKGWKYTFGPYWWTGEDAMWIRQSKDGAWWVLKFTDLLDAGGEDFEGTPYECDVKRLDFAEVPREELDRACASSGWEIQRFSRKGNVVDVHIVNKHDGETVVDGGDTGTSVLLEACITYELGATLHSETGRRWLNVRGRAEREAKVLMRDAAALENALDKPVNRIGTTAREAGRGDLLAGLDRGPFDDGKNLVRKLYGLPPGPPTQTRVLQVGNCPFKVVAFEHYREDGSCKCDDSIHRQRMIQMWGYKQEDFAGIPLRVVE